MAFSYHDVLTDRSEDSKAQVTFSADFVKQLSVSLEEFSVIMAVVSTTENPIIIHQFKKLLAETKLIEADSITASLDAMAAKREHEKNSHAQHIQHLYHMIEVRERQRKLGFVSQFMRGKFKWRWTETEQALVEDIQGTTNVRFVRYGLFNWWVKIEIPGKSSLNMVSIGKAIFDED